MSDSLIEPKKHLALDTDWASAFGMVLLFVLVSIMAAILAWTTLAGRWHLSKPTYTTGFLLVFGLWLIFDARDKWLKVAVGLLVADTMLEVLCAFMHVAMGTQIAVQLIARWVDVAVFVAMAVAAIVWFKSKIRYV